jgi:hypothetical protein
MQCFEPIIFSFFGNGVAAILAESKTFVYCPLTPGAKSTKKDFSVKVAISICLGTSVTIFNFFSREIW